MNIEINSKSGRISFGKIENSKFAQLLTSRKKLILVDENTEKYCLPVLLESFQNLSDAFIFTVPSGENHKTLETCMKIWSFLTKNNFQRKDLVINLGGGMITDIGGFIASVFKRGMNYCNIPTSLLAMADASAGGKTGVNFNCYKNQIGIFSLPEITICDVNFLSTLPKNEILSGKAEMLKHGLIASKTFFNKMETGTFIPGEDLIIEAIKIKINITDTDLKESGERKKLNFGHTVGHAAEGLLLSKNLKVTHGECIAWGMLVESYLSYYFETLTKEELLHIENTIRKEYHGLPVNSSDFKELIGWMQQDKKNNSNKLNFTLLKKIGVAKTDCLLTQTEVLKGLKSVWL